MSDVSMIAAATFLGSFLFLLITSKDEEKELEAYRVGVILLAIWLIFF
jgi:hypothetical protein